jgi:inorganic pyrophosphatase
MSLHCLGPGKKVPDEVNVVIEIPAHSDPVKYEIDKETFAVFVDRFMSAAMHYPCNYGYIPDTLAEDGDPLDVLLITPFPIVTGAVVPSRPVGMLDMEDEKGGDIKLIAVPTRKLTPLYDKVNELQDLSPTVIGAIQHFFEHYKDLDKGKWVKVREWENLASAKTEIVASIERYKAFIKENSPTEKVKED